MGKVIGEGRLKLKLKTKNPPNNSNVQKTSTQKSLQAPSHKPVKLVVNKTPAQLAFEAAQEKKQKEKLPFLAAKSHKEKVAEFNEYLGKLSEHHDIPKVGPG